MPEAREARLQQLREHAQMVRNETQQGREASLQQMRMHAENVRSEESQAAREIRLEHMRVKLMLGKMTMALYNLDFKKL